jgi:DNA-binding MarR family transcriptional regulator
MEQDLNEVLQDERLTVMGLLAETYASLSARNLTHLATFGMAGAEFETCLRLARSPEGLLRMTDLAAQTTLTTSGVTRVVDRLVERGLVTRRSCATDRRTTYAVITPAGRDLLAQVLPGHLELTEQWLMEPLREAGLAEFVAGLRAVRDHAAPCSTVGADGAALPQAGSRSRSQAMSAP